MLRERDRSGIKIDFCPDCQGVWLDRGELDKIIERESQDDDGDDRRDRDDDRRDRGDDRDDRSRGSSYDSRGTDPKKSKKKSFFESLTDLAGGGED